jgi:hypothetical protein
VPFNFRLPSFPQIPGPAKRILHAVPFAGDILNVIGETQSNINAGMAAPRALGRGLAVGGTGFAASAIFPADVPTYAPGITRYAAKAAATPEAKARRELYQGLGIAGGGLSPEALTRTAKMLDYVNPEGWARTLVDFAETGRTYSMDPEKRLEEVKQDLLRKSIGIK